MKKCRIRKNLKCCISCVNCQFWKLYNNVVTRCGKYSLEISPITICNSYEFNKNVILPIYIENIEKINKM